MNINGLALIQTPRLPIPSYSEAPTDSSLTNLSAGWEFGNTRFISDTSVVTSFKRGIGALMLTSQIEVKGALNSNFDFH